MTREINYLIYQYDKVFELNRYVDGRLRSSASVAGIILALHTASFTISGNKFAPTAFVLVDILLVASIILYVIGSFPRIKIKESVSEPFQGNIFLFTDIAQSNKKSFQDRIEAELTPPSGDHFSRPLTSQIHDLSSIILIKTKFQRYGSIAFVAANIIMALQIFLHLPYFRWASI